MKRILLGILLLITFIAITEMNRAEAAHHYLCTTYRELMDVPNTRIDYYIDDNSIVTDDSFVAAKIIYVVEKGKMKSSFKAFFYNLADGRGWCYNNKRNTNGGQPVIYTDYSGHAMDFILKYYNK